MNEDKTVKWTSDYFINNDGNIPYFNVHYMFQDIIPYFKTLDKNRTISPDIIKDNNGCISQRNFNQYQRLISNYDFSDNLISEFTKLKEMKDAKGHIDEDFINLICGNNLFYFRETPYIPYPAEVLKEVLRIAKNSDGTTNWKTANEIVKPIYLLFKKKGQELHKLGIDSRPENNEYNSYSEIYKYCSLLEKSIKNKNGKFSKERIKEFSKIKDSELLIRVLAGKPLDEMIEGKNLYKAEELLEILKELKNTERLNADTLNASIKDFDSLFWAIIEAPRTEENKETYSKVMELFSKVRGLDYNQKDAHGISVLEKVINSENEELLNVIIDNSVKLNYYPELDWAYNGVQNPKFKEKLKSLNLKFKDLEQAAELCSVKILNKIKSQFESPFCDKERVIRELFYTARIQKGKEPLAFVYHLLEEYGEYLHRDLFNEMATWQVSERIKREI